MSSRLEVWAGIECARVRIDDAVVDQLTLTGHRRRPEDVRLLMDLGASAVRYPALWEDAEPVHGRFDWSWADARIPLLASAMRPIVGFLHHGAGPAWTSFLEPGFPAQFAAYARAFAGRYPYVDRYLPINEPLTTARFTGLYGIWWPHARDWNTFARILLAQVLATRAAIEAIREVNPAAMLIQNEDLGRTLSTPEMAYQAADDNERRWLTFDLLCGRVVPGHAFWRPLADAGLEDALRSLADRPSPPDILGVDYYVTSDRFLDHRPERYPEWARGYNARQAYADVEAVRSRAEWSCGFGRVIDDAWDRYGIPVALTEVQLAADPRDQRRWWAEAWRDALDARRRGIDVRAVTAWSAFGAWEWNSLLRRRDGYYEAGAFDAREDPPRPTPLADAIRACAAPTTRTARGRRGGWWRRPDRMRYGVAE